MSANINYSNGKYAFAAVKEPAWHQLGTIVQDRMTSKECIELAGLNFEVGKGKAYVKYTELIDGKNGGIIPDTYSTYRKDTGLAFGTVGSVYEVIQNHEAFSFFDNIVGENRAIYETAGALGNGQTIFITAKLPEHLLIGGRDTINQYILLTMSHDGSSSIIAKFTPIRVVCQNTLSAAMSSGANVFRIKHTMSARDRMKDAEKLLAMTYKTSVETKEILEHLTKIKITDEVKSQYYLNMMLTKNEIELLALTGSKWINSNDISTVKKNKLTKLFNYSEKGAGQELDICKGTAYGAYNAITGYIQNVKSFSNDEAKFSSITSGADGKWIDNALALALDLEFVTN